MNLVTITSQGQITIPAKIRREVGLDKKRKAWIISKEGKVIVEPAKDLLEMAGSLRHKRIRGKSIQEIIKMEEEFVAKAIVERYKRKMHKMRK